MRYATDYHCRGVIDTTLVARSHGIDLAGAGRAIWRGWNGDSASSAISPTSCRPIS